MGNHPPKILIKTLAKAHLNESIFSHKLQPQEKLSLTETLVSLREFASQQPVFDAVKLARESREDLIQRGIF